RRCEFARSKGSASPSVRSRTQRKVSPYEALTVWPERRRRQLRSEEGRVHRRTSRCLRIELPHSHGGKQRRIEVAEMDAMLCAGLRFRRLPVRDAPAGSATDGAQTPIALEQ